jgi:outer membrane receptor for ferrienterochelin and colicins
MVRPQLTNFSHVICAATRTKAEFFSMRCCKEKIASLLIAGLIGNAPFAQAATNDDLLDLPLDQLVQIEIPNVIGASKYQQAANKAPSSVSVITAAEIKNYGWQKLSDVLRSVRGFTATNDRNYDFLTVRGFGLPGDYTSRILLLIDGLRINDSIYQQTAAGGDFPLDIDLVDRVEIIRGPGSALYGSSAFFGVVNVITKKGGQFQGGEIALGGGSFDTQFGRVSLGQKFDNGLEVLFSGSGLNRNGQEVLFFPAFANDPARNNGINDRGDDENWKTFYSAIRYGDFAFQAGFGKRVKNVGSGIYRTVFNDPNTFTVDARHFVDLEYSHAFSEDTQISARVFQQRYDFWEDYLLESAPPVLNRDTTDNQWWGTEIRYVTNIEKHHRLTLGTEYIDYYQQDQANFDVDPAFTYLDTKQKNKTLGLYVQDEFAVTDKFTINVGVRYDRNYGRSQSTNPRLGLIYNPTENTVFKFLYGTAFRVPNGYESYYVSPNAKINPALAPEKVRTFELAVEHSITKNLRAVVSAYRYQINGLITQATDPNDGLLISQNVGKVNANGLDLELQAKWSGLEGRASYSLQRTRDSESGNVLPNSPKHLAKLNLTAPLFGDRLAIGFEAQYVGASNNAHGGQVPGYTLGNLTFTGRNWIKGLDISVGVYNASDKRYGDPASNDYDETVSAIPQEGRNYRAKVVYRF